MTAQGHHGRNGNSTVCSTTNWLWETTKTSMFRISSLFMRMDLPPTRCPMRKTFPRFYIIMSKCWWYLLKLRWLISLLRCFALWHKHLSDALNHILIWQPSPQLSSGDSCQIWKWHSISKQGFHNLENEWDNNRMGKWLHRKHTT